MRSPTDGPSRASASLRLLVPLAIVFTVLPGCGADGSDADTSDRAARDEATVVHLTPDVALGDPRAEVIFRSSSGSLQTALADATDGTTLVLPPGRYLLAPTAYEDPSCGNCEDATERVPATLGARISGTGITIEGASAESVIIDTGAGYGLLFEDCEGCVLSGVTVTGGTRDEDGRATSGGIVVRNASVRIEQCAVRDNIGDSAVVSEIVVGIAGIVGREGSDMTIEGCRIERNSWDGIVLYRGARATIRDNIVDGIDAARGAQVGGGRGVGIGLTWDGEAIIEGNVVRNYWKGIGAFVDARAEIRHNVVEDILTWGIAYWAAGDGRASAEIEENVVFRTGACGVMLAGDAEGDGTGSFSGNAIVRTAQDPRYDSGEPYCTQVPIALSSVPPGFTVGDNLLSENRHPGVDGPIEQLDPDAFAEAVAPLLTRLRSFMAPGASAFLAERAGSR